MFMATAVNTEAALEERKVELSPKNISLLPS
jgi:hypothetical protein